MPRPTKTPEPVILAVNQLDQKTKSSLHQWFLPPGLSVAHGLFRSILPLSRHHTGDGLLRVLSEPSLQQALLQLLGQLGHQGIGGEITQVAVRLLHLRLRGPTRSVAEDFAEDVLESPMERRRGLGALSEAAARTAAGPCVLKLGLPASLCDISRKGVLGLAGAFLAKRPVAQIR